MTKTLYLDANKQADVALAAQMLLKGDLVAFPTETVYGLGAVVSLEQSIQGIFAAKNRPRTNPLILHVAALEQAFGLFDFEGSEHERRFKERFEALSKAFWPGPLTLVGKRSRQVSSVLTAGSAKVAVRIPSHPVAQELLRLVKEPVAAPSANLFTRPSPTSAGHVLASLDGRIDAILDGGFAEFGIESTVVDIDNGVPKVLRHGAVVISELEKHLNGLEINPLGAQGEAGNASPGLSAKHYAPRINEVTLADENKIAKAWFGPSGIILRQSTQKRLEEHLGWRPNAAGPIRALPDDPRTFAQGLFVAFYEMEAESPSALLVEDLLPLSQKSEWMAVCDRLIRASKN